jgi:hypothetical protein
VVVVSALILFEITDLFHLAWDQIKAKYSDNSQANIPFPIAFIDVPSASLSTPAVVASNATTNAELSSKFVCTSEEIRA